MKICYVDEAGCTGVLPSATSPIQPVFVISGIILDYTRLHSITEEFLRLKQRFFPSLFPADRKHFLMGILPEIKGADLRKGIVTGNRNQRRHIFGFLDGVFKIIEDNSISLLGRAWIKGIGVPVDGTAVYTFSIQSICGTFQEFLRATNDIGVVILDSRWQSVNAQVAHSVFTQKFRFSGDAVDRVIDLPAFAHSKNHAGLQIADLLASALLFPIASFTYCTGHVSSVHVQANHGLIKARYGLRIRQRQYRYTEASGRQRGGIIVSDSLTQRPGSHLFQ